MIISTVKTVYKGQNTNAKTKAMRDL